jgi:aspartyl-tRNA synthetase
MKVKAAAYDLVLNGEEIAGGSIRIHDAQLQDKVFGLLGLDEEQVEERFGHMLTALSFGAPPHGGIAYGLDRLIMLFCGEPNIREVIAFPKTGDARDPLTGAPTPLDPYRLKEANIQAIAQPPNLDAS